MLWWAVLLKKNNIIDPHWHHHVFEVSFLRKDSLLLEIREPYIDLIAPDVLQSN